ncbi:MAG TPA: hypothetical protein G4O03_07820 [Dehalococcoidia bacterium]|nr:hypothetical protein [Dehalococcoidia bacterium]
MTRDILMLKGARTIVQTLTGVKPGEKVLVLCDYGTVQVGKVLCSAIEFAEARPFLLAMPPARVHGEELPAIVASAMKEADAIIAPTRFNISHTKARFEAQRAGARVTILPEADDDILLHEGLSADFVAIRPKIERLAELLTKAGTAHLTSRLGTDFTVSLEGRRGRALTGFANTEHVAAAHCLEASIAPVEGTGNGVLICDGSIPGVGLVDEPVKVTFAHGYAVNIEGEGRIARAFRELLASLNDKEIYNVAELGIGMNPKCKLENSMLSDEGVAGSIHVALGTNAYMGGRVVAAGHYDMVVMNPTLELDGEAVIHQGELKLDMD